MLTLPGMTLRNMKVGKSPEFKILKALSLLLFLFFFTVALSGFNIRNASAADCDCTVCHGVTVRYHGDGLSNPGNSWASCFTCHVSPPATGSHSVHSAPLSNTTYGDTVTNTAGQYQFGCGHCHPMSVTLHRNDTIDVSLYGSSLGQSGLQVCNDCHGSNAPSNHGGSCPTIITDCSFCHSGHETGHMSTDSSTITHFKQVLGCTSCHAEYSSGLHAGTARNISNSCGWCHVTTGLSFISHSAVPMTAVSGQCTTCHTGMITTHEAHTGGTAHILTTEATCTNCHSATPRVRPTAEIMAACTSCHGNKWDNHPDVGSNGPGSCIDCHVKGGTKDITYIIDNGCYGCHGWTPDASEASGMHNNAAPPFAAFSASTGSGIDAWKVTLNTSGSVGTISSVDWGDGIVDSLTTHTYASAGVKLITLNVQTASVTHPITLFNYPISGTVKRGGVGLDNVTITLSGTTSGTTVTDANGAYSFSVRPGTYAVHAARAGFSMSADVTSIVAAPGKTNANFTAQALTQTAALTVNKTNSTSGSVSSSPTGISCDATCNGPAGAIFDIGSVVRLTASIPTGNTVISLICTGGTISTCGGTSCYSDVTIAAGGNNCTAVFSDAPYVVKRVSGAVDSYFLNLADGLNAAVNGDVLYLKGVIFNEDVIYDKTGVTVTLKGGYDDPSFTLRPRTTLIGGPGRSLNVGVGTVIVDRVVIY